MQSTTKHRFNLFRRSQFMWESKSIADPFEQRNAFDAPFVSLCDNAGVKSLTNDPPIQRRMRTLALVILLGCVSCRAEELCWACHESLIDRWSKTNHPNDSKTGFLIYVWLTMVNLPNKNQWFGQLNDIQWLHVAGIFCWFAEKLPLKWHYR